MHIPFLDNNPIAQAEFRRLRHTNNLTRWQKIGFALVYLIVVLIAFSPYVYYITPQRVRWLAVMAITVFGFQLYITLRTAAVITSAPLPHTELLTITPMSRWRLVVGKWWGGFKTVWIWYVLTAIPKVGLSLGVMNYMNLEFIWSIPVYRNHLLQNLSMPYVYVTHNAFRWSDLIGTYPMGWIVAISLILSIKFSIMEIVLLQAINVYNQNINARGILRLLLMRGGLTFALLILLFASGYVQKHYVIERSRQIYEEFRLDNTWGIIANDQYYSALASVPENTDLRVFRASDSVKLSYRNLNNFVKLSEVNLIGIATVIDSGTMLNANILKPLIYENKSLDSHCFLVEMCGDPLQYSSTSYLTLWRRRYLGWLLRHLASAAYGIFLHIALTLGFLALAARRHP